MFSSPPRISCHRSRCASGRETVPLFFDACMVQKCSGSSVISPASSFASAYRAIAGSGRTPPATRRTRRNASNRAMVISMSTPFTAYFGHQSFAFFDVAQHETAATVQISTLASIELIEVQDWIIEQTAHKPNANLSVLAVLCVRHRFFHNCSEPLLHLSGHDG